MRRLMLLLISALLFSSPVLAQDAVLINLADTHSAYDTYGRIINAVQEVSEEYSHVPTYILVNGDLMVKSHLFCNFLQSRSSRC